MTVHATMRQGLVLLERHQHLAFIELYTSPAERQVASSMAQLASLFPDEAALLAAFRACDERKIQPEFEYASGGAVVAAFSAVGLRFQRVNGYWYLLPGARG